MLRHLRQNFTQKFKFYLSVTGMGAETFCVVIFICQQGVLHLVHFAMLCMC